MPRYTKIEAKLRASNTTKAYIEAGFNQSELARRRGVHRSTVNKTLQRPPVQQTLQEALRKIGITANFKAKKFRELLNSTRLQSINFKTRTVPDNNTRVSALKLACQVEGDILETKTPLVDASTHLHFTNITDQKLLEEFKRRNIPIPEAIQKRVHAGTPD